MTEVKKDAFRKYLEGSGTIDTLTRVLVSLYEEPERPKESSEYIKSCLGAPSQEQHSRLEAENSKLQEEVEHLKARVAELEAAQAPAE